MAGAAPSASSTLAVIGAATMFVRQCTSGLAARTAARSAAASGSGQLTVRSGVFMGAGKARDQTSSHPGSGSGSGTAAISARV